MINHLPLWTSPNRLFLFRRSGLSQYGQNKMPECAIIRVQPKRDGSRDLRDKSQEMLNFFSGSDFDVVAWLVEALIFGQVVVVLISYRAYHVRFPRKFPFSNQFLRILNHSNLLNGRIDLFLVDDQIAANFNCDSIKVPKLNYQLVISGTKKGPEIANFRASLTRRLHVLVDARWTGSTRGR